MILQVATDPGPVSCGCELLDTQGLFGVNVDRGSVRLEISWNTWRGWLMINLSVMKNRLSILQDIIRNDKWHPWMVFETFRFHDLHFLQVLICRKWMIPISVAWRKSGHSWSCQAACRRSYSNTLLCFFFRLWTAPNRQKGDSLLINQLYIVG